MNKKTKKFLIQVFGLAGIGFLLYSSYGYFIEGLYFDLFVNLELIVLMVVVISIHENQYKLYDAMSLMAMIHLGAMALAGAMEANWIRAGSAFAALVGFGYFKYIYSRKTRLILSPKYRVKK